MWWSSLSMPCSILSCLLTELSVGGSTCTPEEREVCRCSRGCKFTPPPDLVPEHWGCGRIFLHMRTFWCVHNRLVGRVGRVCEEQRRRSRPAHLVPTAALRRSTPRPVNFHHTSPLPTRSYIPHPIIELSQLCFYLLPWSKLPRNLMKAN